MNADFILLDMATGYSVPVTTCAHNINQYRRWLDELIRNRGGKIYPGEEWFMAITDFRIDVSYGETDYFSVFLGFQNHKKAWEILEQVNFDYTEALAKKGLLDERPYVSMPAGDWVAYLEYKVPEELKRVNHKWITRFLFGVSIVSYVNTKTKV